MSGLAVPANQYEKALVVGHIRDYYNPTPCESSLGKKEDAFNRAKAEYIKGITRRLLVAETITFADVFPNEPVLNKQPAFDDSLPFMGE